MQTVQVALKSLFIQAVIILSLWLALHYFPANWFSTLERLHWLPHILLAVAAVMALQFGHSRQFLICLLLIGALFLPDVQLFKSSAAASYVPLLLVTSMVTLLWYRDRGFGARGLAISLFILVGSAGVVIGADYYMHSVRPLWVSQLQHIIPMSLQHHQPINLIILLIAYWLAGLVRFVWLPTNRHFGLFMGATLLSWMLLVNGQLQPHLSFSLLALMLVILILFDSYSMAYKDELTGIKGRRALMQYVATLGKHYTVVMGDVDKFKKFNDTYGHEVGDQVLKMVATCLHEVGGGGRAFRYGGEEFTLIFPGKTAAQAKVYVEEVREAIGQRPFLLRGQDRPKGNAKQRKTAPGKSQQEVFVTASFGVAERTAERREFEQVMKAADQALYKAKGAGRNCVHVMAK